ncbi:MAG TPA: ABC transporter ATP-binding protein [Limnochordia bacterium]
MANADMLVETHDLVKRYGRTTALAGVSLAIPKGRVIGLLGPNGSGKSTLLKLMAGLVHPTSGRVLIQGQPPTWRTKAFIAYLPEVDHLYGWMTVEGVIRYLRAFFADWDDEAARQLVRSMDLPPDARVSALSRGMRARLKIAVTMARHSPLILLDEPLSGIDPPSRTRIVEAIVEHLRSDAQALILSTHEVAETEAIFDDVIFLHRGRIALQGEAEKLRQERGRSIRDLFDEVYA